MSKADTIEDVIQWACFMGTISDATLDRLWAELKELRGGAIVLPSDIPIGPARQAFQDGLNRDRAAVLHRLQPKLLPVPKKGRFADDKSRAQAAMYYAHRLAGTEDRNRVALARWHVGLRQRWELESLGTARIRTATEGTN